MNIALDYQARVPIYEQIVGEIERLVALNILSPGEQIPAIRELALTLGVNPNTIKKAYDTLESRGVIISKSTKGTFITDDVSVVKKTLVDSIVSDINEKIERLENIGLDKKEISKRLKL